MNNLDYITEYICHHVICKLKRLQFVSNLPSTDYHLYKKMHHKLYKCLQKW